MGRGYIKWVRFRDMVFNATFNNISVMLWLSVLLVEETLTAVTGENNQTVASHYKQTLSYNVVSSIPRLTGIRAGILYKFCFGHTLISKRSFYLKWNKYIICTFNCVCTTISISESISVFSRL